MQLNEGTKRVLDESTRRNWNHHVGLTRNDYRRWKLSTIDETRRAVGLTALADETGGKPSKVEADPERVADGGDA